MAEQCEYLIKVKESVGFFRCQEDINSSHQHEKPKSESFPQETEGDWFKPFPKLKVI